MRITCDHPDAPHIIVMLDGVATASDRTVVDADTIGGYIVVVDVDRRFFGAHWRGRSLDNRSRRTIWGKVELIDRRTGKPYDPLLQAAEEAAARCR